MVRYLTKAIAGLLIGLFCGAIITVIILILEGPSEFFSVFFDNGLGPERDLAKGLIYASVSVGAALGTILGLIGGLISAFIRR